MKKRTKLADDPEENEEARLVRDEGETARPSKEVPSGRVLDAGFEGFEESEEEQEARARSVRGKAKVRSSAKSEPVQDWAMNPFSI